MYDFNAFVEDYEYLQINKNERIQIKMDNMRKNLPCRRPNNKSIAGAYKNSEKYHFLKPMMSRHGDIIMTMARLMPWSKDKDGRLTAAIESIRYCATSGDKHGTNLNNLSDFLWASKDMYNARTPWEKFTIRKAWSASYNMIRHSYNERRRLANSIPQSIRTMKAWKQIESDGISGDFVQSYKYRTFTNKKLTWFHSGLAYLSCNSSFSMQEDLRTLCNKMTKVNDVEILNGWVKAMKEFHPTSIGTELANTVFTFISDGARMAIPNRYRPIDERFVAVDYNKMSVLEMINASVTNHRISAEINRLTLEKYDNYEADREMPTLALPEHLEKLRIKTSKDMRTAGAECGHCIGSYSQDTHHIYFRKGNVCAMVSMTSGDIVQCFDRNNKNTPASKKFQSYLTAEIKKADIPFLRTIKKKVIPAEYFNNEVRYDYPF